jgi:predicted nucleotidyltransferase
MNQAALMEVLRTYGAALRENGATGLFMFDSWALGMSRPDSDLDLFIDYDPESKLPNMFPCGQKIETIIESGDCLGRGVALRVGLRYFRGDRGVGSGPKADSAI